MKRNILSLLLVAGCIFPVFAQSNYAVVGGAVTDPQRRPVAGATVQITSLGTQAVRKVSSDAQGIFQITGLLPGDYELIVQATGFAPAKQQLRLEVGQQRNSVYGPGMQTLDLALAREFSLTEKTKFQFRAEFFNALNHTNLGTPGRFVNTPQFGTITEAATPGREVQISMRLSF
jgi:hypothetical protein